MSKSKSNNTKRRRDTSPITNAPLSDALSPSPRSFFDTLPNLLRSIEDRRNWHPEGSRAPARSISHPRHRLQSVMRNVNIRNTLKTIRSPSLNLPNLKKPQLPSIARDVIGFEQPQNVLVCIRREQRRQVLHALQKTGRKGRGGKPFKLPHFNEYSKITCRRK